MLQAEVCDVVTSSERATFIASKYAMLQSWEPVALGRGGQLVGKSAWSGRELFW